MSKHLPVFQDMRSSVRGDGTRVTVHPADVSGRFARARNLVFVGLIALYAVIPWINLNGHPAVLLDLGRRQFFLLGQVFNAQDIWLVFFLLTGIGFALIAATTLLGRVWCGWACPQTVWLEGIFRPIQRLIEGPREQRIRRESRGWTLDRAWRRALLWSIYGLLAWLVAHMFLGYFIPIRSLLRVIDEGPGAHPEAFAITMFATAVMFFNFAWFREQTCLAICPYGRLQSALTDPDSLVIGYDAVRGEPRGKAKAEGVGDCVDCGRCVVVCPTGIDIRNGLQLDCIACSACIDACDEVMDKLHRPRGLIRYDSHNGLHGIPRRFLRPRLALYALLGTAGLIAVTIATRSHTLFEANLLRTTGAPYTIEGDSVRNSFSIHLVNKHSARINFTIEPDLASCPSCSFVLPLRSVTLDPLAGADAPIFVTAPLRSIRAGTRVSFLLRTPGGGPPRRVSNTFLSPAQ